MINSRQYRRKLNMHVFYDPAILILCLHNRNECYAHLSASRNQKWTKYIKQWKIVSPWDGKQMRWAFRLHQFTVLGEFSRLWCKEEEPRQRLAGCLSWGDRAENPGKPRWLKFSGQSNEEASTLEICRNSALSIQLSTSHHLCEAKDPETKEPSKMNRGNSTPCSHRSGNSSVPTSHTGKPQGSGGNG